MATKKSTPKTAPAKRAAPAVATTAAKLKPTTRTAAKPVAPAKPKAAPKAAAKAAPKAAATVARPKKPAEIPAQQRKHYVEMAAYYIAERRGFAPGNPLEDWVQAEAEIDRLLTEGRLGG